MLRFVLTGNGCRDVTKPQLLPSASVKTALCRESSRMNQITKNLLWPCFKNIWQGVGLATQLLESEFNAAGDSTSQTAILDHIKPKPAFPSQHLLHLYTAPGKPSSGENLTATVCKGASALAQGIPVAFYRMVFIAVYRQRKH